MNQVMNHAFAPYDALPSQLALLDESGKILFTNHAWNVFAQDNGYNGKPFEEINYLDICSCVQGVEAEQANTFSSGLRDVLSNTRERFELVYPCHSPDKQRWFKGIVFRHDSFVIVMHVDISNEYNELVRVTEFLSRAEVFHDLRAPLNAILGFAQLSKMLKSDQIDKIHENLDIIHESGTRLLGVVNGVMAVARGGHDREHRKAHPVALRALVCSITKELQSLALAADLNVTVEVAESLEVIAEHHSLRKILANLIGNAIKYNRPGGWVRIAAQTNSSGGIEIKVIDSGLGIPLEQQDQIFEPFYRAQDGELELREGSGLGLSICRDMVQQLGGDLAVLSAPGAGSTFSVRLPSWRTQVSA